ncbi:3-hydroxyacyl-CoA dehydrogenase family protein [Halorarius halobius]|uniref:3-hydroxyacyl-CoA dehydrogenase family protein n=1 Tax=Halorarius halobius TaxID=2962671 RepID=UPI0020CCBB0B|nr:3-hydroxyacyl-CoA dehydrogenase family protein [Halorarius halobius]
MDVHKFDSHEEIERIAVVGSGTMGFGIALTYARYGRTVRLVDADPEALAEGMRSIETSLQTLADTDQIDEAEIDEITSRIEPVDELTEAVADADLVTEAVTEDMDVKRAVFEEIDAAAPATALLTTNTSGLSITEIAEAVSNPERFAGTHWFNPAHITPLVEVIKGEATADETADVLVELLDAVEKTPVRVEKDVLGFIGNRIQMAMIYEAFSLLDAGVASAEDIDRAVKAGFGFRLPSMGIFEKVDQSGIDVQYAIEEYLMPELDRGTDPNPVVTRLVEQGDLGLKTGKGVYDWSDDSPSEIYDERDRQLLEQLRMFES